jgi:hypothetical protein
VLGLRPNADHLRLRRLHLHEPTIRRAGIVLLMGLSSEGQPVDRSGPRLANGADEVPVRLDELPGCSAPRRSTLA